MEKWEDLVKMSWKRGSELADELWYLVRKYIPQKDKKAIARRFITIFENEDCDTLYECEELMKDADLK